MKEKSIISIILKRIVMHLVSTIINRNVTTIAGSCDGNCNETLSGGMTTLHSQAGLFVSKNGTLYVGDSGSFPTYPVYAFEPNNLIGRVIMSFTSFVASIFTDDITSKIYMTVFHENRAVILPSNTSIPLTGIVPNCTLTKLNNPTGIIVDSSGNIYISEYGCHRVMKWIPNATSGILIAGESGISGTNSTQFNSPYDLFLDEAHSLLYVADRLNHRIQKFRLGNSTGATVAGGNGMGSASNQLNNPMTEFVSQIDGSIYICDRGNNRIQRWANNAASGVTIAGSPTGVAGNTPYLLNSPYDIWIDSNDTYLIISDSGNCRVLNYSLH
jgi:hypothetical protein